MWWIHAWWWLENNNFWKAAVAFWVTLILGALVTVALRPWRAWKRHRATQEAIADRLDAATPGGITEMISAVQDLLDALDDPDDNGTDTDGVRKRPHGGKVHSIEPEPEPKGHSIIPNPTHGGGHAGHR